MTLSLAARCPDTGMFGTVVCSSSIAVASRCAHVRARVGAVLTQNVTDPALGDIALDVIEAGGTAPDVIAQLQHEQPALAWRQLVVVASSGAPVVFSGAHALGLVSHAVGDDCAAAGNLLARAAIPAIMVEAFQAARGHLAERLLAALEAGHAAGGEAGPVHAAGVKVAHVLSWPIVDLRVDWSDDPVGDLRALWARYAPQLEAYVQRAVAPQAAPAFGVAGESPGQSRGRT